MNETPRHPSTTPRVTAAWQLSDDRRLTLTWAVPPHAAADEPTEIDAAA